MGALLDVSTGIMQGVIKPILDKFITDADKRLEAELLAVRNLQEINLAQIDVNKIEAASSNLFVSGWRPFIGWVCGFSLLYALVGNDLLNWSLQMASHRWGAQVPVLPDPDTTLMFELLLALLGLGGYRTYEKIKGVAQ